MRKRVITLTTLAVVTVLLASLFAALRGSSSASAAPKAFSACLVTDIGGLNDKSFNHLAYVGLQKAKKSGVAGRVIQSKSPAEYIPNLQACAKSGAGITIGVGFLMTDAMDAVASAYPKNKFAIVDVDVTSHEAQAEERPGSALQGAGSRLPRRLRRWAIRQVHGRPGGRLGRRPQDPAGRPVHRRLRVRRQEGVPGHHGR